MDNKINGKTPEEVKKGLELCCVGRCSECPYREECDEHLACGGEMLPADVVLKDVLALIQQLEATRPKWISVEDELPPVGARVLACAGGLVVYEAYIDCNERWKRANSDHGFLFKITHWMHLPEPQKKKRLQ